MFLSLSIIYLGRLNNSRGRFQSSPRPSNFGHGGARANGKVGMFCDFGYCLHFTSRNYDIPLEKASDTLLYQVE